MSRISRWFGTGPAAFIVRPAVHQLRFLIWTKRGRRGPVPHMAKQRIVKAYAIRYGLETFVETGTYLGDMIWAVRRTFREIHSVELDPSLYSRAVMRFRRYRHVHLHQGDSAQVLAEIVARLPGPTLFWLDGHYSGGITAKGDLQTPVKRELQHVFGNRRHQHVALIDDARDFTGSGDYPSIVELKALLQEIDPRLVVFSADDIIRIHSLRR
jgi:hypothetical protein